MKDSFNILTVDLEEWFVVDILKRKYTVEDWDSLHSTVESNCHRLLSLFRNYGVKATWFVLGWVAERHPTLMRQIIEEGHEIGCHSYLHRRVDTLTPEVFREDTARAVEAIKRAAGIRPVGYRAPSWSINPTVPWAFDVLSELGFEYDSSIFPIKHDIYGVPGGPRTLFRMKCQGNGYLYELPASTYRLLGQNLPVGGGGYFRHTPYWFTKRLIKKLNKQALPVVVYCHPWEVDPDPPQIEGLTKLQKFRSYSSTSFLLSKLSRLLGDFSFITAGEYIRLRRQRQIGFHQSEQPQ